ncbi:MAG: hypothetical protein LBH77_01310 [Tannerella sp.]|jgi:hypothetical protein|nr:hypothetical protein [Tannerella sp.]
MELTLMTLLTIVAVAAIVWALVKLIEKVCNMIALFHASRHPDVTKKRHGLAYNKKGEDGERLEADQSTITPF